MMQTTHRDAATVIPFPVPLRQVASNASSTFLSAADMARHLRQTNPERARCFALAMHEGVAWANDDWGAFWADVVRLI